MQRIRHVARQFVELRAADGTYGCSGGGGVGGGGCVCGVASRGFQSGEAGAEGGVEEGAGREGVQGVVGCEEEVCEVIPAGGGVEGLWGCRCKYYHIQVLGGEGCRMNEEFGGRWR